MAPFQCLFLNETNGKEHTQNQLTKAHDNLISNRNFSNMNILKLTTKKRVLN